MVYQSYHLAWITAQLILCHAPWPPFVLLLFLSQFLFLLKCCLLSYCQGLPGSSGLLNHCNGSDDQSIDHRASVTPEIKMAFDDSGKKNGEYLVTKRNNVDYKNYDVDDRGDCEIENGSMEGLYFENQDLTCSKGVKHGFGNAKRHVLESPFPHLVLTFRFFR
jgi:hypothetical protein